MRIAMYKNSRIVLLVAGVAILLAYLLFALANNGKLANAQEEPLNMKSQLEQLRDEMEAGNLMIGFQFVEPISEGDNYWLFGNPDDERSLTIEEIADDHFCFSQLGGQAVLIRCVPFTNIASFDYLGN